MSWLARLAAWQGLPLGEVQRLVERLEEKAWMLLELAEVRPIAKEPFAVRKMQLAEKRAATTAKLAIVEGELGSRAAAIDVAGALASLERLSDVYDELGDVRERRRLLETCLHRLAVWERRVEFHLPAYPPIVVQLKDDEVKVPEGLSSSSGFGASLGTAWLIASRFWNYTSSQVQRTICTRG